MIVGVEQLIDWAAHPYKSKGGAPIGVDWAPRPTLNLDRVALFADIDAQRRAKAVGESRGFVDVAAEKKWRLLALDPCAQRRAARMLAGSVFVEPGALRRKMND